MATNEPAAAVSRTMPERYVPAWSAVVDAANRRRVEVEVRIRPETELEDDGETLRGTFDLFLTNRMGIRAKVATVKTFEAAVADLTAVVEALPLPGSDALREELREHGRRLAQLTPRDVGNRGADFPLYRSFRDRVLPLAWDNLVDSVRLEALEDFVRKVRTADRGTAKGARNTLAALAEEARGLVPPKDGADG